jgi:hypothetical protein
MRAHSEYTEIVEQVIETEQVKSKNVGRPRKVLEE